MAPACVGTERAAADLPLDVFERGILVAPMGTVPGAGGAGLAFDGAEVVLLHRGLLLQEAAPQTCKAEQSEREYVAWAMAEN